MSTVKSIASAVAKVFSIPFTFSVPRASTVFNSLKEQIPCIRIPVEYQEINNALLYLDFTHSRSTLIKSFTSLGVIKSPSAAAEATTAAICSTRIVHFLNLEYGRMDCKALCMVEPTTLVAPIDPPNIVTISAVAARLISSCQRCVSLEVRRD